MNDEVRTSKITKLLLIAGVILLGLFIFSQQTWVSFMMEDLDYQKNMATGGGLTSLRDIAESQRWLFENRGGSILAQTLLQGILYFGDRLADVLNTGVMLLVALLICTTIGARHQRFFFVAFPFFLLISLNGDWLGTYFLQFGTVSYFYPAVCLLLYLREFCRLLDENGREASVREGIAVALCGLFAGWANAAYGILCIGIAVIAILLNGILLGRKRRARMLAGISGATLGTLLYLLPPGNFHADSLMGSPFLVVGIYPAVILALTMLAIFLRIGGWLETPQLLMLVSLGLAVLMNFVISWIPGVAGNGIQVATLVLGITFFCSMFYRVNMLEPRHRAYGYVLAGITFLFDMMTILEKIIGVN